MNSISNSPNANTYCWFNPDTDRYEAGSRERFDEVRTGSNNQLGFSLILKLENPIEESVIERLISELNIAREDLFQVAC